MNKLPISLALYTSTKGHFGYTDCYKPTISKIDSLIPLKFFNSRVAHIKYCNDNEDIISIGHNIEKWLEKRDFTILSSVGSWKHDDVSHSHGYYADMLKVLSNYETQKSEFVLCMEDDWIINCQDGCDFGSLLESAIDLLKGSHEILAVRINNEDHQDLSNAIKLNDFYLQGNNYTKWGPTLTFQPTIMRTRDWWNAVRIINQNWNNYRDVHCELISGIIMKNLFGNPKFPFAFFNPNILNCTHIGIPEFAKQNLK